jgi:hypothetical protein
MLLKPVLFSERLETELCFVISLVDALTLMDESDLNGNPIPFSISFFTYAKSTKIGGELKHLPAATVCRGRKVTRSNGRAQFFQENKTSPKRNPNHSQHGTRNFKIHGSEQIVKVHIRLIHDYNGMKVVW